MASVIVIDVWGRVAQIPDEFSFWHFILDVWWAQVDAKTHEIEND